MKLKRRDNIYILPSFSDRRCPFVQLKDALHVTDHHVVLFQFEPEGEVPLHVTLQQDLPVQDVLEPSLSIHLALGLSGTHQRPETQT